MIVQCLRCRLEWNYHGKKKPSSEYPVYVICPRCRTTVRLITRGEKNEK